MTVTEQVLATPAPKPTQRVNTATLIMGISGSGKTSLASTYAEYVWETHKKIVLFYSVDGGAFSTVIQKRIAQGLIRVWRMRTRSAADLVFETCYKATRGFWPARIKPSTGETDPSVPLIAPVRTVFTMKCPNGHVLKQVLTERDLTPVLCSTCKLHTTTANMQVEKQLIATKGFEAVGGAFYDGLTSMCGWMINELGQRSGRLDLKGEEAAIGGKIISGDMAFGGSTRSHVGFVQERSQELVNNALAIPNLVASPIFTALSMEALDEGNLSIRGPKLAGKAKADEAAAWFGNVLETAVVTDEKDHRIRRLYLSEYVDKDNCRHLLKNSGSGTLPPYVEDPPEDPIHPELQFTGFNLGSFFRMLDTDLEKALEEKIEGAPGVPDGFVEYGEPLQLARQVPAAAPPPQPQAGPSVPVSSGPALTTQSPTGAPQGQTTAPRARGGVKASSARPALPVVVAVAGAAPASMVTGIPAPAPPAAAAPAPAVQQSLPSEAAPAQTASPQPPAVPANAPSRAAPVQAQAAPARAGATPPAAPRPPVAAPRVPPRR